VAILCPARLQLMSALPPIQRVPSPSWPFIFFHLRKTGGSSFRPVVAMAADELNLTFFVPCLEQRHRNTVNRIGLSGSHMASCNQYYLGALVARQENLARTSVFAGHFYWDATALASRSVMVPSTTQLTTPFSCFIMVREPVARFQSCYTERIQPTIRRPLEKLPLSQLYDILANFTERGTALQQGCNNEIARWISPDMAWGDTHANRGELSQMAVDETKRRLGLCTVGDISGRTNDTRRVLRHWHPWLARYYGGVNSGHRSDHIAPTMLPSATVAAIRQANALDLDLYAFAMAHFEMMLEHID